MGGNVKLLSFADAVAQGIAFPHILGRQTRFTQIGVGRGQLNITSGEFRIELHGSFEERNGLSVTARLEDLLSYRKGFERLQRRSSQLLDGHVELMNRLQRFSNLLP